MVIKKTTPEEEKKTLDEFKKGLDEAVLKKFPDEVIIQFLQANVWDIVYTHVLISH
jgi:hypothetical protein